MLGENGERGRHVFVLDEDLRRDIEVRRREVPDGLDAVADQQVAHALRGGGRDRQNTNEDLPAAAQILQRGERKDGLAAGVRPGDGGVGVKGCDDIQAVFRKAAVAQKRAAELTRADEHGVVRIIIPEELLDILDQTKALIADLGAAAVRDQREVLADLHLAHVQCGCQRCGGDVFRRVFRQRFQVGQIDRQAF